MSEFNNRIRAQRDILAIVNGIGWREQLFGLSSGAIDRWVVENRLQPNDLIVDLVRYAADQLFFLSNKSQEQVTEEYQLRSEEVRQITHQIRCAAKNLGPRSSI